MSLVSGILTIKLYRGEDFPQMDPGYIDKFKKVPKDLADPYCKVSFAGHEVQTPVVKHNYDPEWNSMMKLSVLVRIEHSQEDLEIHSMSSDLLP